MAGKLTIPEMYEKSDGKELNSASAMSLSPRKKVVARGLNSACSSHGGDEMDSECRTADGDHNMEN